MTTELQTQRVENTEPAFVLTPPKSQTELFNELRAAKHVLELAERAYEAKIVEIADELGSTFKHNGGCDEHTDSPVLQIRVRLNKKKGRPVPFFVPLKDFPSAWLGKDARDAKSNLMQIQEPADHRQTEIPETVETPAEPVVDVVE